jgi:hypothetical protein
MGLHWYSLRFPQSKKGILMIGDYLEDHGLRLVQLKEQRRDLIVALMGRTGRITKQQIAEIAAIQSSRPLPLSKLSLSISIPKSSRRC